MTRFARVDLDCDAPLYPSDKVAGRVASRGEHFDFSLPDRIFHSDVPPPMRPPTRGELGRDNYVEFTGKTFGRLQVKGIMAGIPEEKGKKLVVRCVCGAYEVRQTKFLRQCESGVITDEPMCRWCGKTRLLQHGQHDKEKAAAAAQAIMEAAAAR